jgi:hypothetical protein
MQTQTLNVNRQVKNAPSTLFASAWLCKNEFIEIQYIAENAYQIGNKAELMFACQTVHQRRIPSTTTFRPTSRCCHADGFLAVKYKFYQNSIAENS